MTIATVEIVKDLPRDSYGLIFGANLFVALGCQVISQGVGKTNPRASTIKHFMAVIYGFTE
jgi:hypothetical protein